MGRVMNLDDTAKKIIRDGRTMARVKRSGMIQSMTLMIKRVKLGDETFVELFIDRLIDMSELIRVANELGLPVEAQNGRAFPNGTGAKDFVGL